MNKTFSEWEELIHDPVIVTAVIHRLLYHSVVITILGNSYRLDTESMITEGRGKSKA